MTGEPDQEIAEYPGTIWDAPNQQVVRPDESAPWEEGTGGTAGEPKEADADEAAQGLELDEMTKADLLAYAKELGVSPANNDMTKEELRTAVDAHLAAG